jgi:hypothetical protein
MRYVSAIDRPSNENSSVPLPPGRNGFLQTTGSEIALNPNVERDSVLIAVLVDGCRLGSRGVRTAVPVKFCFRSLHRTSAEKVRF